MAKTDTKRRRTRSSKVASEEVAEEECNTEEQSKTSEQTVVIEEDAPGQSTETKQEEKQDGEDPQMDCVIEVKGNTQTVAVSWDKKETEEGDESEKRSESNDQITDKAEETPVVSTADATENVAGDDSKMEVVEVNGNVENNTESQMETSAADGESGTKEPAEEQSSSVQQETDGGEEKVVQKKGKKNRKKRKAQVEVVADAEADAEADKPSQPSQPTPPKKTKIADSGNCIFVGNLDTTKTFLEMKNSLANYLMSHSLLFQDIRVGRCKKYAHIDLASEMDLTKALTLDGEMFLDKPLKIAKATTTMTEKVKKTPEEKKAAKDAKRLYVTNIPLTATKEEIQKVFQSARKITFPPGRKNGSVLLEFKSPTVAETVLKKRQGVKMQGQVLTLSFGAPADEKKVETKDETSNKKEAAPPGPSDTLFVNNVPFTVTEKILKKVFPSAESFKIPENEGKGKGFVFVKFASVEDAEKALKESENKMIKKRKLGIQFFEAKEKPPVSFKTLVIKRLSETTTAETLKSAFEGASSARVIMNKGTGESKRFGFVEFESEEECIAVKKSMWDCEIDGCRVIVSFARLRNDTEKKGDDEEDSTPCPDEQPANPKAGKGRRKGKGRKLEDGQPQDAAKKVKKAKG